MEQPQPKFRRAIPGEGLTVELGSVPWQTPPEYVTLEDALDYYLPRFESEEFATKLISVLEMGVPITTLANTMQLSSVMEGLHSADIGILVLPILMEMLMLVADSANVKYNTGLEDGDDYIKNTAMSTAIAKYKKGKATVEDVAETVTKIAEEKSKGLMSRG